MDNCLTDIYNDRLKTQKAIEGVDGCLTELTAAVTQNIGMALEGEIQVEILGQKLKSVEELVQKYPRLSKIVACKMLTKRRKFLNNLKNEGQNR